MNEDIDVDSLKKYLLAYYGTAMMNGFPASILDLSSIEAASDDEIIGIAESEGINLDNF